MREQNDEADGVLDAVEADLHALVTRLSGLAGARGREVVQAGLDAVGALRQIAEADGPGSAAYGITAEALARAAWNRAGATPDTRRDTMRDKVLGQARLDVAYALSRLARAARAPRGQRVPLARPYAYWKEYRAHGGAA
ncbi:hypothetical protein [Nonomuraea typhae]|uniref:hypothetical protein n=1 Tax=Nonomuraea typhae TaxID=2603600 RepID=UPI0012F8DB20|nr:hypothetical protein [Nonomuraea typhae]